MKNHVSCRRWLLSIIAALAAFTLQLPSAIAEVVTTDQVTAPTPADAERAKVQAFLERASVVEKLHAMGVDGIAADDRVGAMSQEEIHTLAQRIDALPAGGDFTNTEVIIFLLALILVAILL